MTQKTELLRLLRLAWISDHVTADDCKKIDTLLAATAEDVRAVADELIAYMAFDHTNNNYVKCTASDPEGFQVYRHPQRQMVLPERKEPTHGDPYMSDKAHGFNDCLDLIAEKNK